MIHRAEVVMVGTELLLGEVLDTNSAYLARELASLGIDCYFHSTVGDNWLRMVQVLSQALLRSDLVVVSGGLGPTQDDCTREVVASMLKTRLVLDTEALADIERIFANRRTPMAESNKKQAKLPEGARILRNRRGTASGFIAEYGEKRILCLPGVPHELESMFQEEVLPYLQTQGVGPSFFARFLRFVGIGESSLEELVKDLIQNQTDPTIAPYAKEGEVCLRLGTKASSYYEAKEKFAPVEEQIKRRAGRFCYGEDSDTLEGVIAKAFLEKNWTLTTAESCTGGLIAHSLTNVPGSSGFFQGGYVTYSNEAKIRDLGVPEAVLREKGAVSEDVAILMAEGARERTNSHFGLAVTGIAGPGGATTTKPVGLVYIAVAGLGHTTSKGYTFEGERDRIKLRSTKAALSLLLREVRNATRL